MTHSGRIMVAALAMVGASHCPGGAAFAQNQVIGEFAQAIRGRPDQDMTRPGYRVEVLAFAHGDFDPDEEIFPDEPFESRLDTRPPAFLNVPAPRPPGLLATLALAGWEGGLADVSTDGPTVGPDGEPIPGSAESLGPANGATLRSLYEASRNEASGAPGEAEPRGGDRFRIRSAHLQRLIASVRFLDDPSKVPVVFDPSPELPDPGSPPPVSPPDPAPEGPETGSPEDRGAGPRGVDGGASEPAAGTARSPFRVLRPDELRLRDALQRLRRNGDYTPLAHGGWVQATYPPEQAIAVDLALLGTANPVGTVKLHLSRFLHVTVDLVYRAPPAYPPVPATPGADGVLQELTLPARYALSVQRRVRSGEVHYLDHPAIGLLVVVTPAPLETRDGDDPPNPPPGLAA